ncbi:MAG: DNA-binding protein [Oscillibacter sp.]|jgi:predicted DNA-binding protein with PD1-like motif|nr:DNA-binding protein [Oscillibacter sp.]MCI8690094.1 DNA-binding protein [Oscillibacter sp.]MCI8849442.1 DNA-binding protein [Oscillibacter sp.]MCI9375156.1 DNA-binding protein [Oscillibacter sp.]MCI9481175.1 DNA-binding protein [Oscillibacter sp.]
MKAAAGTLKKVHAIRLEPGEDVMQSLQTFCEEHHIGNGAILTGVGSLRGCSYFDPTEIPDRPGYYGYGDPIELPCPIELIAMNGIICTEADGKPSLHIHAAFADENGKEFGGHLNVGNLVLATVELVIGEFEGIRMSRGIDPDRGVPVFTPIQL